MDPYPSFGGGYGVSSIGSGGNSGGGSYPSGSWAIPGSAGSFGAAGNQAGSSGPGISFPIGTGSGNIGSGSIGTGGVSGFSGPGGTSFSPSGGEQMPIMNSGSKLSPVLESSPGSRLFLISPKRESPDPLLMNTLLLGPQTHTRPSQPLGGDSSAFQAVQHSHQHVQMQKSEALSGAYPIYNPYYIPEPVMFRSSLSPHAQTGHAILDHQHPHMYATHAGSSGVIRPAHTPASPNAMEVGGGAGNYSPEDDDDDFSDAPRMIQQHALSSSSSVDSYMQPAIMYRNLFHAVECQLPAGYNHYAGWRIFVDENVGYAGNAKIFKRSPDKNEQALILTCTITDPQRQELVQCSSCKEYFENRMYFKANPHIKGRIILVKNNNLIKVDNGGVFKINIKYMCCCKHHHVHHYILQLNLVDNISNNLVAQATYPIYVKQWRKSTQKKQSCTIILSAAT
jgi:hypothetical protein